MPSTKAAKSQYSVLFTKLIKMPGLCVVFFLIVRLVTRNYSEELKNPNGVVTSIIVIKGAISEFGCKHSFAVESRQWFLLSMKVSPELLL